MSMIVSTRRILLATDDRTNKKGKLLYPDSNIPPRNSFFVIFSEIDADWTSMVRYNLNFAQTILKGSAMTLEKLKPAVSKYWLMALAGLMWSLVGIILCRMAFIWLMVVPGRWALPLGSLGLIMALVANRFGFSKIALKNIARLCLLPNKTCIFAFQAWKSYLIIIFMIVLGITLRHSPIPRHFLAVIYATIGGALFFSSFHFYWRIWRVKIKKRSCLYSLDE